jgi:hypothetical protein
MCFRRRDLARYHGQNMKWILISIVALSFTGCVPADPDAAPASRTRQSKVAAPKSKVPPQPTMELSPTDPCAERLHALCGPLLMYYKLNRKLPAAIEDLQDIAGPDPDVEFTCPESGKPYVLFTTRLPRGHDPGFILISDAEPSHLGLRWAISVEEPRNTAEPLITRVVAEPESLFQTHVPAK